MIVIRAVSGKSYKVRLRVSWNVDQLSLVKELKKLVIKNTPLYISILVCFWMAKIATVYEIYHRNAIPLIKYHEYRRICFH